MNLVPVWNWTEDWNKSLEHPGNLYTDLTIRNIAGYLLESTKGHTQTNWNRNSYEKELFDHLISLIADQKNLEKLTYSYYAISTFRKAVIVKPFKKQILKLFSVDQLNSKTVERYRRLHLKLFRNVENNKLYEVSRLLLRLLLSQYSAEYLKILPKKAFTEAYFEYYKNYFEISPVDALIESTVNQLIQEILHELIISLNKKEIFDFEKYFVVSTHWNEYIDKLVRLIRSQLLPIGKTINKSIEQFCINGETLKYQYFHPSLENVLKFMIEEISLLVLLKCLEEKENTLGKGKDFANYDLKYMVSKLSMPFSSPADENALKSYFVESSFWIFLEEFKNRLIKNFTQQLLNKELDNFCSRLSSFIESFAKKTGEKDPFFDTKFEEILASFQFKLFVSDYAKEFFKRNLNEVSSQCKRLQDISWLSIQSFVSKVYENVYAMLKNEGFKLIPHEIDVGIATILFNKLFNILSISDKTFKVFFLVSDMDCKKKIFKIGNVTFYDPREWDFGESFEFDIPIPWINVGKLVGNFEEYQRFSEDEHSLHFKRNSARAFVSVKARDRVIAIEKAKLELNQVINCMIFSSSTRSYGGSRPTSLSYYYVVENDLPIGTSGTSIPSHEIEMLEITDRYKTLASYYNNFLSTNINKYRDALSASLEWYAAGRWSASSQDKYTFYWIALEQLITSESSNTGKIVNKKCALLSRIPSLVITWHTSSVGYYINQDILEIKKMIKNDSVCLNDISNDPILKNWEKYPFRLLEHLSRLKKICKGHPPEKTILRLQGYLDTNSKYLTRQTELRKKQCEFLVANLYLIRNEIVHEGLSYKSQFKFLTKELEQLLVDTMVAFFSFGQKAKFDQIVKEYNRPYNKSVGKLDGFKPNVDYTVNTNQIFKQ